MAIQVTWRDDMLGVVKIIFLFAVNVVSIVFANLFAIVSSWYSQPIHASH